jgi:hypothetical protein
VVVDGVVLAADAFCVCMGPWASLALDITVTLTPPCIFHSLFSVQNIQGRVKMTSTCRARKLQGWPKSCKLAQVFDCKSLLAASSCPNFWANPVNFTSRPAWRRTGSGCPCRSRGSRAPSGPSRGG